jgi:hypothetical protein
VITPIDVDRARKLLADAGVGVGGTYVGESFSNWGGLNQGVKYDGVLDFYINGDMSNLGKGLRYLASVLPVEVM